MELNLQSPPAPQGARSEWLEVLEQQQHMKAIRNANGSRMTAYKAQIGGWRELEVCVWSLHAAPSCAQPCRPDADPQR